MLLVLVNLSYSNFNFFITLKYPKAIPICPRLNLNPKNFLIYHQENQSKLLSYKKFLTNHLWINFVLIHSLKSLILLNYLLLISDLNSFRLIAFMTLFRFFFSFTIFFWNYHLYLHHLHQKSHHFLYQNLNQMKMKQYKNLHLNLFTMTIKKIQF